MSHDMVQRYFVLDLDELRHDPAKLALDLDEPQHDPAKFALDLDEPQHNPAKIGAGP